MDPQLKQRLVGATVLVALAVLLIPAFLDRDVPPPPRVVPRDMAPMPPAEFATAPAPLEPALVSELESELAAGAAPIPDPAPPEAAASPVPPPAPASQAATRPPEAAPAVTPLAPRPPRAVAAADEVGTWYVQLGSFGSRENAERLQARLRAAGHEAVVSPLRGAEGASYRVRIARASHDAAEGLRATLARDEGYRGILVRE